VIETCVFCGGSDQPQTAWNLADDVHWLSAFTHEGEEPPMRAGRYTSCPTCTRWVPRHRAGALPSVMQQAIHAAVAGLQPQTRRQMHAELVGRWRHLAAQLQPADG
jgi:hypothetical protein